MRILLDYRPALRQRTGVGEYVHQLVEALIATTPGTSERIALFSASWKDRLHGAAWAGTDVIDRRIPGRLLNFAWHRLEWPPVERIAGMEFDVVHAFHPLRIPARRAAQLVTIHDLDFLDHPERTRAEIRRDYARLAPSHARAADRIVVNSQTTSAEVQRRFGIDRDRISVCYPGAPAWSRRADEPLDGCLLFLGALEPRKNLGVLLDAYERLLAERQGAPPLVLAGPIGPDAAAIVARASRPPLSGHVELPGYVTDDQRLNLYRRGLLFVMPSYTEGFGMPVLEAMTVGVPVIAARRGALPEVGGDAAAFFEPDTPQAPATLAATIHALLGDTARRQHMRELGWKRAAEFDWRRSAAVLREAWTLAVETRRLGGRR